MPEAESIRVLIADDHALFRRAIQAVLNDEPDIEAARAIKEELPSTQVVMFTVSDEEADLFEAIKAGANGYLLKEVDPTAVADAVRQIHSGHSLLSPAVASKLVSEFATMAKRT